MRGQGVGYMYDNDGYFCCLKETVGYASTKDSNGCASPGYAFQEGERALSLVSAGQGGQLSRRLGLL